MSITQMQLTGAYASPRWEQGVHISDRVRVGETQDGRGYLPVTPGAGGSPRSYRQIAARKVSR